ncbi:hypothetical protein NPIL_190721 [Nephila pilipes]|uniref:Uncharacterized protein n=1 Tax=Nephila pilipes TaxID=299642 RepID=A0A8X6U1M8_NEPPI|nr:hypothetical protein NPIL_190721 [Nephila pilipes]
MPPLRKKKSQVSEPRSPEGATPSRVSFICITIRSSLRSPTETILRLVIPLRDRVRSSFGHPFSVKERRRRSEDLTDPLNRYYKVYKGQGLNRHELMNRVYWGFLVQGASYSPLSPARRRFIGLPGLLGQGKEAHAVAFIVLRVRPRTSKGITDLFLLFFVRLETACSSKKIISP